MIQLFHVSKSYAGSMPGLIDVSFHIKKGEFVFITGPSGAGKTTLLKLICATLEPTGGQMIVEGRNYQKIPPKQMPYFRRRVGFVFQDFKLLAGKTVFENVAIALKIAGISPAEIRRRVTKTLTYLRIQHRANFMPLTLSGGEQQRVAIARAIVKEPVILLADEPTGNLDQKLAIETMELFQEVNNQGTTVLVATHDNMLLDMFHKRVIALEGGRLVEE
jgi:cell division transport system ATP-binding protein